MSKLVPYTIINPTGGYPAKILRTGFCQPAVRDMLAQPGELMLPVASDHQRQAVGADGSMVELLIVTAPDRSPDPLEVIIEALKAKGIAISVADLAAAKQKIITERTK